jgi:RNA polymerase sigma factor (sigma-70 family)
VPTTSSRTVTIPAQAVGDEARLHSIEQGFRVYRRRCYGVAVQIVRDPELAHDVVQDVFEAVVSQPEAFLPERGSLLTWLTTLTHHKAVDLVRWHQRHTRLDFPDDGLSDLATQEWAPEDEAWLAEERTRVIAALRKLAVPEREVLMLAHFAGYSQQEIAHRMGLPLGTVKSRTRIAMTRMRGYLSAGELAG